MMERINTHNVEAYLLDLLEGRLDEKQKEAIMLFLEGHPDLIPENWNNPEAVRLVAGDMHFPEKQKLLKKGNRFDKVTDETAEAAMIAWWEGDLSTEEREKVLDYIGESEEREKLFDTYGKLYLQPEASAVFRNKGILSRKEKPVIRIVVRASVAAAIIVMALFPGPIRKLEHSGSEKTGVQIISEVQKNNYFGTETKKGITPAFEQKGKNRTENTGERQYPSGNKSHIISEPEIMNRDKKIIVEANIIPVREEPISYYAVALTPLLPVREVSYPLKNGERLVPEIKETDYLSIQEWLAYEIKSGILKEENAQPGDPISAPDFLNLGIKGLNTLTGWNIRTEQYQDTTGKTRFFALTSQLIGYTRERKNK
ncbi:MAG: hypothetical protein GXO83_05605 [Chlorobi bacterium]|nr:hypothetical protein [Chlorobiota bacterium]